MKKVTCTLTAVCVLVALGLFARDWALGSGRGAPDLSTSSGTGGSAFQTATSDVSTEILAFNAPIEIAVDVPASFGVEENIRNDGPSDDQVVVVMTLEVPASCEGQIDSSLQVTGPDTAVVFGTLPHFSPGTNFFHSESITIECSEPGLHPFVFRKEVQPLFNDDPDLGDNVVVIPFNGCEPSDPNADVDGDGLTNTVESGLGTDPCLFDTDGDGMPDGYEAGLACLDPLFADGAGDPDVDDLVNVEEFDLATDPCNADSDGDEMPDGYEVSFTCLDPLAPDAAGDPDFDGVANIDEFGLGTDPCGLDTDDDGMPDGYEAGLVCLDPVVGDADVDPDLDGLTNIEEFDVETDPCNADTDSDGLLDGYEASFVCLDPFGDDADLDPDLDGLTNIVEQGLGTSPCLIDTDDDQLNDGEDNCPTVANADQLNTPIGPIGNGAIIPGDDDTNPFEDRVGDACDTDADNDGLPDAEDTNPLGDTGICVAFADSDDGHLSSAGGDITNDDDGDGDPAPPMGTDGGDDGPSWDTDNDGVRDGVECLVGHNPRNVSDRPSTAECGGASDSDEDGLEDAWEVCKWGTYARGYDGEPVELGEAPSGVDPTDSDGDGLGDCTEVMDIDGDGSFTFSGDLFSMGGVYFGGTGDDVGLDLDGDNAVTFAGDLILIANAYFRGPCV